MYMSCKLIYILTPITNYLDPRLSARELQGVWNNKVRIPASRGSLQH